MKKYVIMMDFKQFRKKFQGTMHIANDGLMAVKIKKVLDFSPNGGYIPIIMEQYYVVSSELCKNDSKAWALPRDFNGFNDARQVSKRDYEKFKRKWE